jgi:hypothetical protein
MTLKDELYADVLNCFLDGTYEEWQLAERRYYRFLGEWD